MTKEDFIIISENIVKPCFLNNLKNFYDFVWCFSKETKNLDVLLKIPVNFFDIRGIIELSKWFKYQNSKKNVNLKFRVLNWEDEREFDFQNSKYSVSLRLNFNENSISKTFFEFCDKFSEHDDIIKNCLRNILNDEYFI